MTAVVIDGSILEGGGQILRNCVAYSILTKRPLVIHSVRGNRKKPGLQLQHLTGIRLAIDMSKATVTGLERDSTELAFQPHGLQGSTYLAEIPSAGACTLVLQLALPVALFCKEDVRLVLKGGTNVPLSPSVEYLCHVLLPTLSGAFGLGAIELDVVKRGFMPSGGGELVLNVKGSRAEKWRPCEILQKGRVISYEAIFVGYCTREFLDELSVEVTKHSEYTYQPLVHIVEKGNSAKSQILLVAKTDSGCIFGASALGGKKQSATRLFRSAETLLLKQLAGNSCVDEHLQDQLIIYMALAAGPSKIRTGQLTLHTKTAIHFAQVMTGAQFSVEKVQQENIITCTPCTPWAP